MGYCRIFHAHTSLSHTETFNKIHRLVIILTFIDLGRYQDEDRNDSDGIEFPRAANGKMVVLQHRIELVKVSRSFREVRNAEHERLGNEKTGQPHEASNESRSGQSYKSSRLDESLLREDPPLQHVEKKCCHVKELDRKPPIGERMPSREAEAQESSRFRVALHTEGNQTDQMTPAHQQVETFLSAMHFPRECSEGPKLVSFKYAKCCCTWSPRQQWTPQITCC